MNLATLTPNLGQTDQRFDSHPEPLPWQYPTNLRKDYLGFYDDWNITSGTDSYKFGAHWKMLPDDTQRIYSYAECRQGAQYDQTLFFGLQYILMKRIAGAVVQPWMLEEGSVLAQFHLGDKNAFNYDGWKIIIDEFGGRLPIEIKAVPEGTLVPTGNVLFTITDTDPQKRFAWLVNYIESILMKHWYPCAVASRSHAIVKRLKKILAGSSDNDIAWMFLLHDFGYRSTTCEEAAEIGGASHLINSIGTDTVPALKFLKKWYGASYEMLGLSVPASEHSIECAYGPGDGEFEYVKQMLLRFPRGIVSVVADGYGIERFVTEVVPSFKDDILARWQAGQAAGDPVTRFVIRPDSPRFAGDTAANQCLWIYQQMDKILGHTINSFNKKVIHPAIGTIYGDGLQENEIYEIYEALIERGYDPQNQVVGQGGGLLQKLDRDTQRTAIKCSAQLQKGKWINVQKTPSDTTKMSKSGHLALIMTDAGEFTTKSYEHGDAPNEDELITVLRDGYMHNLHIFGDVRKRGGLWV